MVYEKSRAGGGKKTIRQYAEKIEQKLYGGKTYFFKLP